MDLKHFAFISLPHSPFPLTPDLHGSALLLLPEFSYQSTNMVDGTKSSQLFSVNSLAR
jgi:hypothetical protein